MLLRSATLALKRWRILADIVRQALLEKSEPLSRRLRSLLHTAMGTYFAALIESQSIGHIHVHHGYFASWVAMVAARLLDVPFSLTLHGSDLLLHKSFLKTKLRHCRFCTTISEFNRAQLLSEQPAAVNKVFVCRMGVTVPNTQALPTQHSVPFSIFAAGRLHPIKGFDFLLQACRTLIDSGFNFRCQIAGEGSERKSLERTLDRLRLRDQVLLIGQLSPEQLSARYQASDLFVLTSKSEGIPLVLMEAMAQQRIVLAPRITGIPELIVNGKTGFLYQPGDLDDFVRQVRMVERSFGSLDPIRRAAKAHVAQHFEQRKNVAAFCDLLISHSPAPGAPTLYANPVLQ